MSLGNGRLGVSDLNASPSVAVILVNWNGQTDTLACLESLAASNGKACRVIVVDNGSTDGSTAAIRMSHPSVEVIDTGENLGFTGGNNVGVRSALAGNADFVWLLNNDTTINPATLPNLLAVAERHPDFGILTPLIYYFDRPNDLWFGGSRLDLSRGEAIHDNDDPPGVAETIRQIPWASGCSMFIRRALLDELTGFDDRFFLNWEDVDLSVRATSRGWKIGLVSTARIEHKVGRSIAASWGIGAYYYVRNHLLLVSLHPEAGRLAVGRVMMFHIWKTFRSVIKGERDCIRAAFVTGRAIHDYVRRRFGQSIKFR